MPVKRALRIALTTLVLAAVSPAAAHAADRMWVGFQDDPSFRWEPDRLRALDQAQEANATVLRTTVYWSVVALERPAQAANPFDPAYKWDDLDLFVRDSQKRGMEVLLTIWGTPRWANGGKGQNRVPSRYADLTNFARALATRYSGRYPGLPYVRFYSVWNEPNLGLFLSPQYNSKGRSVGPALYARLYRAAYTGLKLGSPSALVGIGETSARGRDRLARQTGRRQETHSPGRFAELLSKTRPRLRFDAWSHHPYPTTPQMRPTQQVRWPNVSLASLPRFEAALDRWFKRKGIPIWITEYGHETRGQRRRGVTPSLQAFYARQALTIARKDARVQMFIWFILEDNTNTPWESGIVDQTGVKKPAFAPFAAIARAVDARNAIVRVRARPSPTVRVSAFPIGFYSAVGSLLGVTYRVFEGARLLAVGQPQVPLAFDAWFTLRPSFAPRPGGRYRLELTAGDANGNVVNRRLTLLGPERLSARRR